MAPCIDCTLTYPHAATHVLYFVLRQQTWKIYPVPPPEPRARYCRWHATVRAVQRNAAWRRLRPAPKENA
jgi:hypothetical protein